MRRFRFIRLALLRQDGTINRPALALTGMVFPGMIAAPLRAKGYEDFPTC